MLFAECYCCVGIWVCIVVMKSFDVFCELEGRVDLGEISKAAECSPEDLLYFGEVQARRPFSHIC